MQKFKGDATEQKFIDSATEISDALSLQKDTFLDEAFECFILGELLYDNDLCPLANAIDRTIFRESFSTIFDSFLVAGTFESYLTVFRNIFGDDVDVTFTVPGAGMLNIDIVATGLEISDFVARQIESNAYVFYEVITQDFDNIVFQTVKGFQSQYELEQMLFEMVPAGVYTEISLTI